MSDDPEKQKINVQAEDNSVAVGSVHIGGNVEGSIQIGHTIGYTAVQVSTLIEQISTTFEPKKFDGRCPYKGLDVFEEEDAELFFGRETLVADLVNRVKESRTVFITGPSGSGKSSLVRAGLIHALKQGAIKNSERWLYGTMKPGREPIPELARIASSFAGTLNAGEDIRTKGLRDMSILSQWCEIALKDSRDKRAVIFIDQFEEVFTQINSEEERVAFLNLLTHAAAIENGRVIILFSMRSDFISNCQTYHKLNELLGQKYAFAPIGAMQPNELVSAIAQPTLRVGLKIDPDLIAQIINDMQGEPGALPLMEFALEDLFSSQQQKSSFNALTLYDYNERGGIRKALERHADGSFNRLDRHEQELARSIFSSLIEVGRGSQDTCRTAVFDELIPANEQVANVKIVVQKLADARLITTDEQAGKDTLKLAHEKLIDAWPWLRRLIDNARESIQAQNQIAEEAGEWERHDRDPDYLYRGARLTEVRAKVKGLVLSSSSDAFLKASGRAEQGTFNKLALRKAIGVLYLILPLVLLLGGLTISRMALPSSIGGYYHTDMSNIFVGMFSAIGLLMFLYNGYERKDWIAAKIAGVSAFGFALFPTSCDNCSYSITGFMHGLFGALFFLSLLYFTLFLFTRSDAGRLPSRNKLQRNKIYRICGAVIAGCLLLESLLFVLAPISQSSGISPTYWLESIAILAGGVSWLTKGQTIWKD